MTVVDVETIAACRWNCGSAAPADWLGPKVGSCLALFHIHQMNWVNSRNSRAVKIAP